MKFKFKVDISILGITFFVIGWFVAGIILFGLLAGLIMTIPALGIISTLAIPVYCLSMLFFGFKYLIEATTIYRKEEKPMEVINTEHPFSIVPLGALEATYNSLEEGDAKESFLKGLQYNKEAMSRAKMFKDIPDKDLIELAKTDFVAQYVLNKRKK